MIFNAIIVSRSCHLPSFRIFWIKWGIDVTLPSASNTCLKNSWFSLTINDAPYFKFHDWNSLPYIEIDVVLEINYFHLMLLLSAILWCSNHYFFPIQKLSNGTTWMTFDTFGLIINASITNVTIITWFRLAFVVGIILIDEHRIHSLIWHICKRSKKNICRYSVTLWHPYTIFGDQWTGVYALILQMPFENPSLFPDSRRVTDFRGLSLSLY